MVCVVKEKRRLRVGEKCSQMIQECAPFVFPKQGAVDKAAQFRLQNIEIDHKPTTSQYEFMKAGRVCVVQ